MITTSHRLAIRSAVAFLALGLAACDSTVAIPADAQITCGPDAACPEDWECAPIGRCILSSQIDKSAPALVGAPQLSRGLLTAGARAELRFEASEALSQPPEVRLLNPAGAALWTIDTAASSGLRYVYSYTAQGTEPVGSALPLEILLVDETGNPSAGLPGGSLAFDFSTPDITAIVAPAAPVRSPRGLEADAFATVSFTTSEPIALSKVSVEVRAETAATCVNKGGGTSFSCTWTAPRELLGELSGSYPIAIRVEDAAGNVGEGSASVIYDAIAPTVITSVTTQGPYRTGAEVLVVVSASEPLASAPVVRWADSALPPFIEVTSAAAGEYRFRHIASGAEPELAGGISFEIKATDPAGNDTLVTEAPVVFDFTAPLPTEPLVASPSFVTSPGTISTTFSMNEPIDLASTGVTVNGNPASLTQKDPDTFAATYAVDSGEPNGQAAISYTLVDLAGNVTVASPSNTVTVDTIAPTIALVTLTEGPFRSPGPTETGSGLDPVVEVTTSEPLSLADGQLTASLGGNSMSCSASSPTAFTCVFATPRGYTDQAHPWDGMAIPVDAVATDSAGNRTKQALGAVTFDFTTPTPTQFTVTRTPKSNALIEEKRITKVHVGSTFAVSFYVGEPLASAPEVVAYQAASSGLHIFSTTDGPANLLFNFSYALTDPSTPQGPYDLYVTLQDVAGNTFGPAQILTSGIFDVDTVAPVLGAAELASVVYRRVPWGESLSRPHFTVKALAPSKLEPGTWALVYDLPLYGDLLATVPVSSTGELSAFLGTIDRARVYLQLVDSGANSTSRQLVTNGQWVVSMRGKRGDSTVENPHYLAERPMAELNGPLESPDKPFDASSGVESADGTSKTIGASAYFRHLRPQSTLPREAMGSALENATGRILYFGGESLATSQTDQTLAWDGQLLSAVDVEDVEGDGNPIARVLPAMAHDLRRNKSLLFGGKTGSGAHLRDTWEFEGNRWRKIEASTPPPARHSAAMVYDVGRDGYILFGGTADNGATALQDTWFFSSVTRQWVNLTGALTGNPGARYGHAMVHDPVSEATFVIGGRNGPTSFPTWLFAKLLPGSDPAPGWVEMPADPLNPTRPTPRAYHAATYDPASNDIVLFGGRTSGGLVDETWTYDFTGDDWINRFSATRPTPRERHTIGYDRRRGAVILYGGNTGSTTSSNSEVWQYTSSVIGWQRLATGSPGVRAGASLGYMSTGSPSSTRQPVLFGGRTTTGYHGTTYQHDGVQWVYKTGGTPSPRAFAAMAMTTSSRLLLFGGKDALSSALSDAYTYSTSTGSWTAVGTGPSGRSEAALAFDGTGRTYLFGGWNGTSAFNDLWYFNGSSWIFPSATGSPAPRRTHGLAFDTQRQRLQLFGGLDGAGAVRGDLAEYNPSTNAWSTITPADPEGDGNPAARYGHLFWYDAIRLRSYLFGGVDASLVQLNDLWEWTPATASWRLVSVGDPFGNGRPSARSLMGGAYTGGARTLIYGGEVGSGTWPVIDETWEIHSGGNDAPAFIFRAHLAEADFDLAAVTGARLTTVAGSRANTGTDGYWLRRWVNGDWQTGIYETNGTPETPFSRTWSYTADELRQQVYSDAKSLCFAIAPGTTTGSSDLKLALDYLDLAVDYRISPP